MPLLFVGLLAPGAAQQSRLAAPQDTPEDTADVPAFPVSAVTIQDKIDWLTAEADAAAHSVDAEAEKPRAAQRESIYRGVLTRGAHLVRLLNTLEGRFPRLEGRVNEVMTSAAAGIERIANRRLKIGMTTEQVREIRGEPSSISDTSSDEGSRQQWRYGATVLVFDNGTLIEIRQMLKGAQTVTADAQTVTAGAARTVTAGPGQEVKLRVALSVGDAPAVDLDRAKTSGDRPADLVIDPFVLELQERTFRFFWDTANAENGLVPDRYPTAGYSSIAAVGFGLTTYPIGVERGYITRQQAQQRVLATLRFLARAPQSADARGATGHRGFFYHFLDMKTGERYQDSELSTVDTAILVAGVLFCQSYFTGADAVEVEIRALADEIYRRVDWQWAQPKAPAISLGWSPEEGFLRYDWRGYNEAMLVYLLALGSPTFPVGPDAWAQWTSTYDTQWGTSFGQEFLGFSSLFAHQYTHVWTDLRDIRDPYMQRRGLDYFENSRRAVSAQRAYAVANPRGCRDYGATIWGITASDGPADVLIENARGLRRFRSYSARGMDVTGTYDDCTLAPTAVVASMPFAPELVIPATLEMHRRYGQHIYSTYGFLDSFNRTFLFDVPLRHGRHIPKFGWVAGDYLGIDQGAMLAMIENYRSALVWRVMRKNPYLRRGLERAGFSGGWLGGGSPR